MVRQKPWCLVATGGAAGKQFSNLVGRDTLIAYSRFVQFEWDPEKARRNERVHGVGFEKASVFLASSVPRLEIYDTRHSEDEDRFLSIGPVTEGVILVVWVERTEDCIRIISARWANKREAALYHRYVEDTHG